MTLFNFSSIPPKSVLGLDISSTAVKLIELSLSADCYKVKACHSLPLPINTVIEKDITNVNVLAQTLKQLVVESGTKLKNIAVAVPDVLVITKEIELPAGLTDMQLEAQVALEISEHIAYPIEEIAFDFEVMMPLENNQDLTRVLVTACLQKNIENLKQAIDAAGFTLDAIDIQSCVIERAFRLIQSQSIYDSSQLVAIADIGATSFNLTLLVDGRAIYSREQLFGGKQLVEEIQRRYGLSWDEFCKAKYEGVLPHDYESNVLMPFKKNLIEHIIRALQIFYASSDYNHIDQLFLVGGLSALQGLTCDIETALSVPTEVANVLADMLISKELNCSGLVDTGPAMLLAVGLALRSFD